MEKKLLKEKRKNSYALPPKLKGSSGCPKNKKNILL